MIELHDLFIFCRLLIYYFLNHYTYTQMFVILCLLCITYTHIRGKIPKFKLTYT